MSSSSIYESYASLWGELSARVKTRLSLAIALTDAPPPLDNDQLPDLLPALSLLSYALAPNNQRALLMVNRIEDAFLLRDIINLLPFAKESPYSKKEQEQFKKEPLATLLLPHHHHSLDEMSSPIVITTLYHLNLHDDWWATIGENFDYLCYEPKNSESLLLAGETLLRRHIAHLREKKIALIPLEINPLMERMERSLQEKRKENRWLFQQEIKDLKPLIKQESDESKALISQPKKIEQSRQQEPITSSKEKREKEDKNHSLKSEIIDIPLLNGNFKRQYLRDLLSKREDRQSLIIVKHFHEARALQIYLTKGGVRTKIIHKRTSKQVEEKIVSEFNQGMTALVILEECLPKIVESVPKSSFLIIYDLPDLYIELINLIKETTAAFTPNERMVLATENQRVWIESLLAECGEELKVNLFRAEHPRNQRQRERNSKGRAPAERAVEQKQQQEEERERRQPERKKRNNRNQPQRERPEPRQERRKRAPKVVEEPNFNHVDIVNENRLPFGEDSFEVNIAKINKRRRFNPNSDPLEAIFTQEMPNQTEDNNRGNQRNPRRNSRRRNDKNGNQ